MTKTPWIVLAAALALPPAFAAGPFDGNYGGQQKTMVTNNSGYCQNLDHAVQLSVVNNVISYPWGRTALQATVAADGSFAVEQPGIQMRGANSSNQLKGRINAGALEADVGGNVCGVHLSLRKK